MKIRFTRGASTQLELAIGYLADESPSAAANLMSRIDEAVARLSVFPGSGHATDERAVRALYVTRTRYILFYRIEQEGISIVRIRHASRKPLARR